ncbi:MAG: O-antigen ligase family protein [Acidobacteriota bacterium]
MPEAWGLMAFAAAAALTGVHPSTPGVALAVAGPAMWLALLRRPSRRFAVWLFFGLAAAAALTARGNGPAGTVAVAMPLALGLLATRGRLGSWAAGAVAAAGCAALLHFGSRGAAAAAVAGLATFAVLSVPRPRRRLALGALGLAALVAAFAVASLAAESNPGDREPLWRSLLLEDQVEGLSLNSATTGRIEIWRRALWIVEDLPGLGAGPGRRDFARTLELAYPGAVRADHAHQLLLHTAATLGLPAAALWLFAWGRGGWRLAGRLRGATPDRRRADAGVAGAMVALAVFSLADALPITDLRGLFSWPLLALATGVGSSPAMKARRPAAHALGATAVSVILSASALAAGLSHRPAVDAIRQIAGDARPVPGLADAAAKDPHLHWLRGRLAQRGGRTAEKSSAWSTLLAHGPGRLPLLVAVAESPSLGRDAVERWPRQADAWRLLARTAGARDRDAAVAAWRRVVALDPRDGRAWLELGDLLAPTDPDRALGAYARGCVAGDPGANACLRGGRIAERLGADIRARALYRRSRYAPVRALADRDPAPP